jgi:hypothetical protein
MLTCIPRIWHCMLSSASHFHLAVEAVVLAVLLASRCAVCLFFFVVLQHSHVFAMAFVFATQQYPFDINYLGCVPLAQVSSETVANEAVELLYHKLESLQVSAWLSATQRGFLRSRRVLSFACSRCAWFMPLDARIIDARARHRGLFFS